MILKEEKSKNTWIPHYTQEASQKLDEYLQEKIDDKEVKKLDSLWRVLFNWLKKSK